MLYDIPPSFGAKIERNGIVDEIIITRPRSPGGQHSLDWRRWCIMPFHARTPVEIGKCRERDIETSHRFALPVKICSRCIIPRAQLSHPEIIRWEGNQMTEVDHSDRQEASLDTASPNVAKDSSVTKSTGSESSRGSFGLSDLLHV